MNVVTFKPFKYSNPFQGFFRNRGLEDQSCRRVDDTEAAASWGPVADIYELEDAYLIKLEVPGVSRGDIEIEYCDSTLIIKGERKEDVGTGQTWHLTESLRGKFMRRFVLPRLADAKNIAASLNNGVLEVRVPKSEDAKPKSIEIK